MHVPLQNFPPMNVCQELTIFRRAADRQVVAAGGDESVLSVHTLDGDELWRVHAHQGRILAIAWNPDGTQLATASQDGTAKVYSSADGTVLAIYCGHQSPVHGIAFAEEGHYLVSSGEDHQLHVWRCHRSEEANIPGEPHTQFRLKGSERPLRNLAVP